MKDREYKDAWQDLKASKIQDYIQTRNAYGTQHIATIIYSIDLEKMDKLDGTQDFSNLLSDLEDE
ncbi:hypothetical protein [Staphylococcus simulans]|uniref:hypothetical protein n=1 Tax=Staphylococcus simulans TaxID=1286 RepID=UPI000E6A2354|nr:hypothetical protein [Staphylococcus simulans]RIN44406.1 hypothetical protein BU049_11220 [Staphylococcus simulans]RIN71013.1 hypothetical protein BU017_07660 [Staphylococcus simulans]